MKIGEKIADLRKQKGYSQEELAELLGVSRQSVSKWELDLSTPDLDKIIKLSDIFQVQIDTLIKDEKELKQEDLNEWMRDKEVERFLAIKEKSRFVTAIAVGLCILSPICLIVFAGSYSLGFFRSWFSSEDQVAMLGIIILLLFVMIGVGLLVYNSSKTDPYEWIEREPVLISSKMRKMLKERKEQDEKNNAIWTTIGVCLCIVSVIPLFVSLMIDENYAPFGIGFLLLLVAIAVFIFIYIDTIREAIDMLLQEGEYSLKEKHFKQQISYFPGVYWCVVTAIYLLWSFTSEDWEQTWLVFAIAGVLYAAILAIMKARIERKDE